MAQESNALSTRRFRLTIAAFLGALLFVPSLWAQEAPACPPTATLDQLPKAIDDAVSGPGNKDHACMRALLIPEARLIPTGIADGQLKLTVFSVDQYIDRSGKRGDKPIYERQVKYSSETFGHIAHLWSTYEIRETPDGKAIVRGINSIQAVFDGTRWKVVEIFWQPETATDPLPPKYLP